MKCDHTEDRVSYYAYTGKRGNTLYRRQCLDCQKMRNGLKPVVGKLAQAKRTYSEQVTARIIRNPGSSLRERDLFLQDWNKKQADPVTRDWRAWLFDQVPELPVSRSERDHSLDRLVGFLVYNEEDPDDYV
ncbi:hypothetical protein UFOVP777_31 [uncultured Caudovirales phage]|uniref:Uncharacterized protein n=1 Tax=uncultured Caudovirales phage TaxID=2100421 RepID=A0A6J5NYG5_9CAUD|nr:hypothetical protein UFOVP777_31 [uncultured Caudovirales phage]